VVETRKRTDAAVKLFRSKSIGVQRKALELVLTRVKKIHGEFQELSQRNWTGGEMEIAKDTRAIRDQLSEALALLKDVDAKMIELEKAAVRKGK